MATNAVQVSADEQEQEGVQEVKVNVPGVGEVSTFFKVLTTDDVDGKTTEGVNAYSLAVPVEVEEEEEELDEAGEPIELEDGSFKLKVVKRWKTLHYELDMAPASLAKLTKALAPYLKNAREVTAAAPAPKKQAPTGPNTAEVRQWAWANNILFDGKRVSERGRVPQEVIDQYVEAHK